MWCKNLTLDTYKGTFPAWCQWRRGTNSVLVGHERRSQSTESARMCVCVCIPELRNQYCLEHAVISVRANGATGVWKIAFAAVSHFDTTNESAFTPTCTSTKRKEGRRNYVIIDTKKTYDSSMVFWRYLWHKKGRIALFYTINIRKYHSRIQSF